jgi:crossover junction endodeoxyribonuclease RusA
MIIELPFPSSELMPNRKNGRHWGATKDVKDSAISKGFYLTKAAAAGIKFRQDKIALTITFVQSDKRHRDLDNLLASSKAYLDGVARALGIDDKNFEPIIIKRGYNKLQSATVIELKQDHEKAAA